MNNLAIVVDKESVESVLSKLRQQNLYDGNRRIRAGSGDSIEIPVIASPELSTTFSLIEQSNPEWRSTSLEDRLRRSGWSDEELEQVPKSWAVIGSVLVLKSTDCPRLADVGEALLSIHGQADTVVVSDGVDGEFRRPDVRVIAGTGDTETIHREHGVRYALDISAVMFSPGNQRERARMGEIVTPNERVFDMFAGIGYFTLPMARAGARVTASEINPIAFKYLIENARLNGVSSMIDAYRSDCRDLEVEAERIVMGCFDASQYLNEAFRTLSDEGMIHFHALSPADNPWSEPEGKLYTSAMNHDRELLIKNRNLIKSHSAGLVHVVIDAVTD